MSDREGLSNGSQWGAEAADSGSSANFNHSEEKIEPKFTTALSGSLADELFKKGYHPVMLFGTRAAGKSSLLASLFHYLQSDPESPAIAVRGEWIIPTETTYGKSVADAASRFLNHILNNFHDGNTPPATHDEFPFYIPVILRPNNGHPEIKLAFLESKGEWYQIKKDSTNLYPELRDEVADVYRKYPNGISILMIAPYVIGDAYSDQASSEWAQNELRDSDTALFGALQAYQFARQRREFDKFLFILTKWDAHIPSIVDKDFLKPPRGMVSYLISQRFPKSWTLFQNMQTGEAQSMQYSAGLMSGDARVDIPEHLKPIMNRFPQMLWRWLYSNSTGGVDLFNSQSEEIQRPGAAPKLGLAGMLRKLLG
jgi:hypothetical protein